MNSAQNGKAVFFSAIAVAAAMFMPLANAQTPMTGNMPMAGGMDMKTMMKDNNDKMSSMTMTGNADVDFAMMMRIHHQGAIDMAQAELKNGKEPQMRKMAQNIIAAQKKEIAQFDRFLTKHGHPTDKMSK
ncbi:MAG: DUF305 domain-containing protein [Pseudomonadota bacterium]